MRIYAKQVPWDYQQPPLYDLEDNSVYIYGNRDYESGSYKELFSSLESAANDFYDMQRGYYGNSGIDYNLNDILRYCLPRNDGQTYTREQRKQWAALLNNYEYTNEYDAGDFVAAALELITGEQYENTIIRGCCQGDWSYVLYPAKWGDEWRRYFECEFFNTGAEWALYEIDDDAGPAPDDADEIPGEYVFHVYTHEWDDDEIKKEIADAAGCDPGDVVLYKFTGWGRVAGYGTPA